MRYALAFVAAAAAAVGREVARSGDVERSLSAYQHTPAGPFWVAALLALGVALVAARATSRAQAVALDATGALMAFVVLVPETVGVHVVAAFLLFLGLFAIVVTGRDVVVSGAMACAGVVSAITCLSGWTHWFVAAEAMFAAAFAAHWVRRTRTSAPRPRTAPGPRRARALPPTSPRPQERRTRAPRSRSPRTTP